ncbi:MAG TPA: IPT/TIG domain-containing protein [Acidimicrobiales bacterium]|nr:IPT/TIG domain-containing protein [Acidimicrobiales bacterium]
MKVRILASGVAFAVSASVAVPLALGNSASAGTAAPTITHCLPATATMGKKVTIHGTGLSAATKVAIDAKAVTPLSNAAKSIKVPVPTGIKAASNVKVVTANGTATAVCNFQKPKKSPKK